MSTKIENLISATPETVEEIRALIAEIKSEMSQQFAGDDVDDLDEKLQELRNSLRGPRDLEYTDTPLSDLGIDVPDFITCQDSSLTDSDALCIVEGGCASGAYMPAVTYVTALETMSEHGDTVFEYIESTLGEIPVPEKMESWSGLAVFYVSTAVELFCGSVIEESADYCDWDSDTDPEVSELSLDDCLSQFKELYGDIRQAIADDEIAVCEDWNNYTDALCKDGKITEGAYNQCPAITDLV